MGNEIELKRKLCEDRCVYLSLEINEKSKRCGKVKILKLRKKLRKEVKMLRKLEEEMLGNDDY